MILHHALRALRDDDAPQCAAQASLLRTVDQWRAEPDVARTLRGLEEFTDFRPLAACPALAALFAPGGAEALALARHFAATVSTAIAAEPLGQVPLRHYTDGLISTLLLGKAGNVSLTLVTIDGAALLRHPQPAAIAFGPHETWEMILAGTARGHHVERMGGTNLKADIRRTPLAMVPGDLFTWDGDREAKLMLAINGQLTLLRLQRRKLLAGPTREYNLATGALIHQAAGNPRDSRLESMMALVGRMGRGDAAPHMARLALAPGSTPLRWQALRECLALDTAAGFAALCEVAARPEDELSGPALDLRKQLLATYPQLSEIEPCLG